MSNAPLLDKIERFLDDGELFQQFKDASRMYSKRDVTPEQYLRALVKLFGADVAKQLTPKIAKLVRDPERQDDLLRVYQANIGGDNDSDDDSDDDESSSSSSSSSSSEDEDDDDDDVAGAAPTLDQLTRDEGMAASNLGVVFAGETQSPNKTTQNTTTQNTTTTTKQEPQQAGAAPPTATFDPMDPLSGFVKQSKADEAERKRQEDEASRIREQHFKTKQERKQQELAQQSEFLKQQAAKRSAHLVGNASVERLRDECLKEVSSVKQLNTTALECILEQDQWEFTPWNETMMEAVLACKERRVVPHSENILKAWRILSVNGAGKEQERLLIASTDALYRVNFDWHLQKPKSFERQEWRDIRAIQYGPFTYKGTKLDDADFEFGIRVVPRQQAAKSRIPGLKSKSIDSMYRTFKARDPPLYDESFEPTLDWMRDYYKSVGLEMAWLFGILMRIARRQFSLVATNCNTTEVAALDVNSKRRQATVVAF